MRTVIVRFCEPESSIKSFHVDAGEFKEALGVSIESASDFEILDYVQHTSGEGIDFATADVVDVLREW